MKEEEFVERIKQLRKLQTKANFHHKGKYAWVVIACQECRDLIGVFKIDLRKWKRKCPSCGESFL